jgi:rhodanese-related sulfurtransferase
MLLLAAGLFFLLCACSSDTPSADATSSADIPAYQKISAEEAKRTMGIPGIILLDVRTEEEFLDKRIDGAVLIPDYEIAERAETELTDKDAIILLYCRSGRRSADAAKTLADMGYTQVYDFGGIIDWPYDTVSGE